MFTPGSELRCGRGQVLVGGRDCGLGHVWMHYGSTVFFETILPASLSVCKL